MHVIKGVIGVIGVKGVKGVIDVIGVKGVKGVIDVIGVKGVKGVKGVIGPIKKLRKQCDGSTFRWHALLMVFQMTLGLLELLSRTCFMWEFLDVLISRLPYYTPSLLPPARNACYAGYRLACSNIQGGGCQRFFHAHKIKAYTIA